jgi:hypothetical protein
LLHTAQQKTKQSKTKTKSFFLFTLGTRFLPSCPASFESFDCPSLPARFLLNPSHQLAVVFVCCGIPIHFVRFYAFSRSFHKSLHYKNLTERKTPSKTNQLEPKNKKSPQLSAYALWQSWANQKIILS